MKKITSLLIILVFLCVSLTSCGFDEESVRAELVGTWVEEGTPMNLDNGMSVISDDCYVLYSNGEFLNLSVMQYYKSGKTLGNPIVNEKEGTYKIYKDKIKFTNDSGWSYDKTYLWNEKSGKITQLGSGWVKVSNSTDYLDSLIK